MVDRFASRWNAIASGIALVPITLRALNVYRVFVESVGFVPPNVFGTISARWLPYHCPSEWAVNFRIVEVLASRCYEAAQVVQKTGRPLKRLAGP